MVELATDVCDSPQQALAAVRELRRAAAEAAGENGLRVAAAGTHPFSVPEQQDIAPDKRYRQFVEYAGISARRQAVCGLHVHIGMPGAEECMRALEGVLPWLPAPARALGQLALPRRRGDRSRVRAGGGAGAAASRGGAAGLRLVRELGGVRRALRATRARRRLHAVLVGRASAPEVRDPRDPRSRPADRGRALAARSPRCSRRSARPPSRALRPPPRIAATTRRTVGQRSASAPVQSSSTRRATASPRCRN